jgi:hypothetical protein
MSDIRVLPVAFKIQRNLDGYADVARLVASLPTFLIQ